MAKPPRSPLLGYNHNLTHLGRVFHIQTEDSGPVSPRLFTHLFYEGTILVSRKHEYDAALPDDKVRALMQAQHKTVMKDLMRARLDGVLVPFFATRGIDLGPAQLAAKTRADAAAAAVAVAGYVEGAVPAAALSGTPGPLMVMPEIADAAAIAAATSHAQAELARAAGEEFTAAGSTFPEDAAARMYVDPVGAAESGAGAKPPDVEASDATSDARSGSDASANRPAAAHRRTATRSFEAVARPPTPAPVVVRAADGRRSPFVRSGPPVAARMSSADGVVVQRNLVVGGGAASPARPARIRPPVPYVVTGGGYTERPPKGGAAAATTAVTTMGTGGPVGQQSTSVPSGGGPAQSSSPLTAPSAATAASESGGGAARATGAFGVGLADDKSLDEVILEYLSEDGDPA